MNVIQPYVYRCFLTRFTSQPTTARADGKITISIIDYVHLFNSWTTMNNQALVTLNKRFTDYKHQNKIKVIVPTRQGMFGMLL